MFGWGEGTSANLPFHFNVFWDLSCLLLITTTTITIIIIIGYEFEWELARTREERSRKGERVEMT